jgi:hypothetical protein
MCESRGGPKNVQIPLGTVLGLRVVLRVGAQKGRVEIALSAAHAGTAPRGRRIDGELKELKRSGIGEPRRDSSDATGSDAVSYLFVGLGEVMTVQFYRVYNMDPTGQTVGFKSFPAHSEHDACLQALSYKEGGNWHAMELWTGTDQIDCSELADPRPLGRKIELPAN